MKRILAILCAFAMLLSLPMAPGVFAAEAEAATPSALVNLWNPLTRTNGLMDAAEGIGTNSGSSNAAYSWGETFHNSSEFMPISAGETIYWGPALASQGVHVAFATTADADTFTWEGKKANTTVVDTFDDGYQIRSWTATSDGYFSVAAHSAVINDELFMVTKEPVGGDGSQALTVKKYLDHFNNNVYHLNATGKRIADDGSLTDSIYYSSTGLIPVTPGETLTFGPIVPDQDTFGHTYDSAKASVCAITANDLTKVFEMNYDTGYYGNMGSNQIGINYPTNHAYLVKKGSAFYTYTVPDGVSYIRATFDIEATPKFMLVRGRMDLNAYKAITGNTNSSLFGKTALFVGDSITHATQDYRAFEGINHRGWPGRIADLRDMLVYNFGRGNSSMSNCRIGVNKHGTVRDQLDRALEQTDVAFDHVVIAGGTNDLIDGVDAGTVTADNVTSGFDLNTFAGGLEATIAKAKEYFGSTAAISYIINSKIVGYTKANANDVAAQEAYGAAAKAICEKWDVNCIDLLHNATVTDNILKQVIFKRNSDKSISTMCKGTGDNLHPNEMGYDLIAPIVAEGMEPSTVMGGEAYNEGKEPAAGEIVNLWTLTNRNWGVANNGTLGSTKFYNGPYSPNKQGRRNPGHSSSEWIDVEAGDVLYIGAAYYNQSHINWLPDGSNKPGLISYGSTVPLESSTNGKFRIVRWTAPQKGKASVISRQMEGNDDFFLITKNRPFDMVEYMDYFNNNIYIFNTQGKYLNSEGEYVTDTNYFTTEYIKVTPGETLTLGPVLTGTQNAFGHTFSENMKPVGAISSNDLTYQYSFDYANGYYTYSQNGLGTKSLKAKNTVDKYAYYLAPGSDVYTYTVPEGVAYIRACFMTNAKTKSFVVRGNLDKAGYYALNGISADNPLIGKKALFLGDSITEALGDYRKEGVPYRGWAERIADKYDMLVDNYGVSGFSLSTRRAKMMILDEISSARHNDYDYVVIHGGANDFADDDIPVGTVVPGKFDFNDFNLDTFAGGLEATIARAKEVFGDTAAFVYIWNFEIRKTNWFTGCDKGCQPKYYPAAKAACEKWGVPMIDLYNNEFVRAEFYDETIPVDKAELRRDVPIVMDGTYDNVHPNALGYDILAKVIGEELEKLTPVATPPVDKEDTVVTVIGDALTEGLGSTDIYRKSYPSVLQDFLGENYKVINFGMASATVQQDQKYAFSNNVISSYSFDTKADKVVIMLGTNDLKTLDTSAPKADERLTDAFTAMIKSYRERFPDAEIYLATPPAATNATVANGLAFAAPLYEALAAKLGVRFIDVYSATKNDVANYISDNANANGIWYNDEGYAKIAETVLDAFGLPKAAKPVVDTTAEYTGTYPSVPTVSQYAADAKYQGYDAYRIVTAEDFRAFGDLVAAGDAMGDKTVYLENDLDLVDKNVHPIGRTGAPILKKELFVSGANPPAANAFRGTFDGNGHTVNVEFHYYNVGVGLFASTNHATIKNLNLTGSVRGHDLVSSVAAYCDGASTLENVWSDADVATLELNQMYGTAGIAAQLRGGGSMSNVGYSGTVTGTTYTGGLVCYAHNSTVAVKNCFFIGEIISGTHDVQANILVPNAAEVVHSNNYITPDYQTLIPGDKYATSINATAFATGEAAVKLNNEGDIWTVKNGKTVIAAPEDQATFTLTVDGKPYYTDHKGQVAGEFKTETGYFRLGDQLITDAEMSEYQFSKENAILNSVAKLAGDASGNGTFEAPDVTAVMRHLIDYPDRIVEANADYTGNGIVNVADCVRMLQALASTDPLA